MSHPFASLIALTLGAAAQAAASGSTDTYLVASIILGIAGLLILVIELFVPTGGLLAILCTVSFIGSVVAMFMWSPAAGIVLLAGYAIAAPFALVLFLKLWSKSPIVRKYALKDPEGTRLVRVGTSVAIDPEDPDAPQAASDDARRQRAREMASFVGLRGIVETPLRPIGFVRIAGHRLDASAETGLIEPGTPIRVVAIVDGTLKVRADG